MAASSACCRLRKPSPPRTNGHLCGWGWPARSASAVRPRWTAFFFSKRLLPGNTAQRPVRKESLIRAASMCGNDGKCRHFFVKLAEPADDLVRKSHVIVAVPQDQRLSGALFETAFVVDGVTDVKQTPCGREVHENAHAPGVWPRTARRSRYRLCKGQRSRQMSRRALVRIAM